MASVNNITDRASTEHKAVCIKAGIIPGTGYALKFCEYIIGAGNDWYTESEDGKVTWKGKEIKEHKKAWIKERAGAKSDEENAEAELASSQSEEAKKQAEEAEKNAKTTDEKLKAAKNKIDVLEQQIKKLNREKNDVVKSANRAGRSESGNVTKTIQQIEGQIKKYEEDIKSSEENIKTLKQQLDTEKQAAAQAKKEAQEYSKGNKWWYKELKRYKQDEFKKEAKGAKPKKVSTEFLTEDLITLAVYANKENSGPGKKNWQYYDAKVNADPPDYNELNSALGDIWKKFPSATSIRNEMDKTILEEADAITPDASTAMLKGAVSNTFEMAALGKELITNPDLIKQRGLLMADATAAALNRLTSRVTSTVTMSIAQILDVTPITRIPADAAQEMVKHILTPGQVMELISKQLNDDALTEENDSAVTKKINETKEKFNEKVQEINFLVGDKLKAFNDTVADVKTVINQGPDWYIDNINKLEIQYEKEAIKAITDVTANVLDTKYQFRDNAVDVISYNLVIPVNEAMIKVQLEVIRALVQAIKLAEAKAKALIEKAIMMLMGLLGA
jgi:hypothetical protein